MTCTYCHEPFKCGDCGELYPDCECQVYQSQHVTCHKVNPKPVKP